MQQNNSICSNASRFFRVDLYFSPNPLFLLYARADENGMFEIFYYPVFYIPSGDSEHTLAKNKVTKNSNKFVRNGY